MALMDQQKADVPYYRTLYRMKAYFAVSESSQCTGEEQERRCIAAYNKMVDDDCNLNDEQRKEMKGYKPKGTGEYTDCTGAVHYKAAKDFKTKCLNKWRKYFPMELPSGSKYNYSHT